MKTFTAALAFLALSASGFAQGQPDAAWTDTFTSIKTGPDHANTSAGNAPNVAFRLTYQAVGMTAVSIQIEGAPCNATCSGPGSYTIIPSSAIVHGTPSTLAAC